MAENLDLRYAPQPSLQEGFIDKQTGLPLSFGLIFSYKNQSRNQLKPIYELQEALPGGPVTYVPLPNPIILSGVGTIQNQSGDDVIPYFFPFEADGVTPELYYIIVTDQYGTIQFTREAFPNASGGVSPNNINFSENFIPNAQFLLNNPPSSYPTTQYTFDYGAPFGLNKVVDVAPGGWTYQVNLASTSSTSISFQQFTQPAPDVSAAPRYEIKITRIATPLVDTVDDLRIRFMDVNKFQSTSNTDRYTFMFNAVSSAGNIPISIRLIKYFGTSGSSTTPVTPTEDTLWNGPFTINPTQTKIVAVGEFGNNTGKSTGTNNDDFLELAIRFPVAAGSSFIVSLTDFMLVHSALSQGEGDALNFPVTTNGEFVLQALSNLAPTTRSDTTNNYYQEDGSNLYLPIIMTKSGFTYDYSQIGMIEAQSNAFGFTSPISNITNLIICDGSTYVTSHYSNLGIPFARLQKVLFDALTNTPIYGTGANFGEFFINSGNTSQMIIDNNNALIQAVPVDGAAPTGFTFPGTSLSPGGAHIGFNAYVNPSIGTIVALATFAVSTVGGNGFGAGTSGMLGGDYNSPTILGLGGYYYAFVLVALPAAALAAGALNPGLYFDFSNNTTNYRMWFQVTTEIAPAAGGRTLIQVNLDPTMGILEVADVIAQAISQKQVDTVTVAGAPPAGSYFSFFTHGNQNNVYYVVAGVGAAPPPPTGANIKVELLGTETNAQIATKTQIAVNSYQFAVPNLQGQFLRGFDPTGIVDIDNANRYVLGRITSSLLGSYEIQCNQQHWHPPTAGAFVIDTGGTLAALAAGATYSISLTTGATGSGRNESRPYNVYVNYCIRY